MRGVATPRKRLNSGRERAAGGREVVTRSGYGQRPGEPRINSIVEASGVFVTRRSTARGDDHQGVSWHQEDCQEGDHVEGGGSMEGNGRKADAVQ